MDQLDQSTRPTHQARARLAQVRKPTRHARRVATSSRTSRIRYHADQEPPVDNLPTQPPRKSTRAQPPKPQVDTTQPLIRQRSKKAQGKKPVNPRDLSRSREDVVRGKQPVFEPGSYYGGPSSEEESNEEAIEEAIEEPPHIPRQVARQASKKGPKKLIQMFMDMPFLGTRYPHQETMKALSLEADVRYMMNKCNLGKFYTYAKEAYKEETCHFLATLEIHLFEEPDSDPTKEKTGYITFQIRGKKFTLPFAEIEKLYGFRRGPDSCQDFEKEELVEIWRIITGKDGYSSSRSKSSHIRNPAIRYFHKSLANTFFARQTTGNVNDGEVQFLDMALKDLLNQNLEGPQFEGDRSETGLTVVLMYQLLYYKEWATRVTTIGSNSELCVGGIITPILEVCGVQIKSWAVAPRFMDIKYLIKANFLDRESYDGQHLYRFIHPTEGESRIALPAPRITRMRQGQNINFAPPPECLYLPPAIEEDIHQTQGPTLPEPQPQTYGHVEREEQNQRIGMLEKITKWQSRTLRKLKNTVKEMRVQIKDLQNIVSCSTTRPEAQGPTMMERSRSSSAARQRQPSMEPPRTSATLVYQRRRRATQPQTYSTSSRDQEVEYQPPLDTPADFPLDQHVAPPTDQEAYSTFPLDIHVEPMQYHTPSTTLRDHDLECNLGETYLNPEPISYLLPSDAEFSTQPMDYSGSTQPMDYSGSTQPMDYENETSTHAEYTKESMDDATSSFFSKP